MSNKTLKFFDFCSGIGAGRMGLENNGLECVGHSEIDFLADQTYKVFYGDNEQNIGDLMAADISAMPDFDVMVGGFPCQTFSSVGQRAGFDDERGQVVFGLMKILKEKNVPYFILENVKGFVTHEKGQSLKTVLTMFDELGYAVYWKVLNSINFGVPQSRERVYLVGIRKDIPHKPIEWETGTDEKLSLKDCLKNLHSTPVDIYGESWQRYLHTELNDGKYTEEALLKEEYLIVDRRNRDVRVYRDKVPTLRKGNHGLYYVHNKQLYKVNGYQGLLLQGFPKEFVKKAKKNDIESGKLLGQVGNAMTVNVMTSVCRCLLNSIGEPVNKNYKLVKEIRK